MQTWFDRTEREVFVIGEVAQAHDGSLGSAHAYIDVVAEAGASAVKFQTHIAAAESTPSEPWRVRFSPQDETRYDYWRRMEFEPSQWRELKRHAEERGLVFLSSPFSVQAVELLDGIGISAWKIASGELTHDAMLDAIDATGKPVLVSTGMSPWREIDRVVGRLRADKAVFQCTSAYPCPPEKTGLNLLGELSSRYDCPVGLSDHSATLATPIAAVALGAELLEVHVALSRSSFGPDTASSLLPQELAQLVEGVRRVRTALAHPVDKDEAAEEMAPMRALFQRSLVPVRPLPAGHVLEHGDLIAKKPGTGLPPQRLEELLGRRLRRDVAADELIDDSALSDASEEER